MPDDSWSVHSPDYKLPNVISKLLKQSYLSNWGYLCPSSIRKTIIELLLNFYWVYTVITTVAVLSPSPNVDLWLGICHYRQSVNFQNDPFSCMLKEELNEGVRGMGGWVSWSGGEITTLFCVPELYYPAAQINTNKRANVTPGPTYPNEPITGGLLILIVCICFLFRVKIDNT